MKKRAKNLVMITLLSSTVLVGGCVTARQGSALGGAVLGTVIGHQSDHEIEGALGGAVVGLLFHELGRLDKEEKQTYKKFCPEGGRYYPMNTKYCPKHGAELKYVE